MGNPQENGQQFTEEVLHLAGTMEQKGLSPVSVLRYESTREGLEHVVVLFDLRSFPGNHRDDFEMARLYGVDELNPPDGEVHATVVSTDTLALVDKPELAYIIDPHDEWLRAVKEERTVVVFGEANPRIQGETLRERVEHILYHAA